MCDDERCSGMNGRRVGICWEKWSPRRRLFGVLCDNKCTPPLSTSSTTTRRLISFVQTNITIYQTDYLVQYKQTIICIDVYEIRLMFLPQQLQKLEVFNQFWVELIELCNL